MTEALVAPTALHRRALRELAPAGEDGITYLRLRRTELQRVEAAGWVTRHPWKVVITDAGRHALAIPPVPEVPGEAHIQLIRHHNGGPLPTVRVDGLVYDECEVNGWHTPAETDCGFVATPAGCAAIGEPLNLPRYAGLCPRAAAAESEVTCGRVVVVPCSSAKLDVRGPAGSVYVGSYHQATRRAAAALGGTLLVLSARYGLIGLDQVIDPYDLRMGQPGCVSAATVAAQAHQLGMVDPAEVIVLAGKAYADVAAAVWPHARRPLDGTTGIGPQLHLLAETARTGTLPDTTKEHRMTAATLRRRIAAGTSTHQLVTTPWPNHRSLLSVACTCGEWDAGVPATATLAATLYAQHTDALSKAANSRTRKNVTAAPRPRKAQATQAELTLVENLFAALLGRPTAPLTRSMPAAASPGPAAGPQPGDVLALHEVPWGTYGTVKAMGPTGKRLSETGYLTKLPRIYTGGEGGKARPQYRGVELLSISIHTPSCTSSMYCPLTTTFTVVQPPADFPLRTDTVLTDPGCRMPARDLRAGDIVAPGYLGQPGSRNGGKQSTVLADPEHVDDDRVRIAVSVDGTPGTATTNGWQYVTVDAPVAYHPADQNNTAGPSRTAPRAGATTVGPTSRPDRTSETPLPAAAEGPADAAAPKPGDVLPLHQVPLGTYGTVKGIGADCTPRTESGYLTKPPRVYTGGPEGRSAYKGVELLSVPLYQPYRMSDGGETVFLYAPLGATFTVAQAPADRPLPDSDTATWAIWKGRRLPARDVRAGDVLNAGQWEQNKRAGAITVDADPVHLDNDQVQIVVSVGGKPTTVTVRGYDRVYIEKPVLWTGPPDDASDEMPAPRPEPARQYRALKAAEWPVVLTKGQRPGRKGLVHIVDWRHTLLHKSLCGVTTPNMQGPDGKLHADDNATQASCGKCKSVFRHLSERDLPLAEQAALAARRADKSAPTRRRSSGPATASPATGGSDTQQVELRTQATRAAQSTIDRCTSEQQAEPNAAEVPVVRHDRVHSRAWTWACPVPTCLVMRNSFITARLAKIAWRAHCNDQTSKNHPADFRGAWPHDIPADDTLPADAMDVVYGTVKVAVIYKVGNQWAVECAFDHGDVPYAETIGSQSDARSYAIAHGRALHQVPDPQIPDDEDLLPKNPANDMDPHGLYRRIRDEADAILNAATNTTDADVLAWAAGVTVMTHTVDVSRYLQHGRRANDMVSDYCGGTLDRGRFHDADRSRGFRVTVSGGRDADGFPQREEVFKVTWARVKKLLDRTLAADETHLARVRQAEWRRGRVLRETLDYTDQRRLAERTCHEVAAMLWDAARPHPGAKGRTVAPPAALDLNAFLLEAQAALR